ncbi:hypothetical protein IAI10_14370 [Clostridium sp. 19966]|uniref:lysine 5,6-aminomutase reactivase subunit KamB n=1 Tax=Clostridium sp. 19966 TaxID=2768166 RepID=UPI0028DDF11B|nr:hypothetical protein [Clostridium sp. 19966]MDT8717850.1 hypothetical protein [Clostridium sp. 19966]
MKLLDCVGNCKIIAITGLGKNVGKTTALNKILEEARGKYKIGITSIGYDGEQTDRVTHGTKPRIYVEKGTYAATAKKCLGNSDVTKEIIAVPDISTAIGEIVIVKALSDGYVELAGPSIGSYMRDICRELIKAGSQFVIVDGALERRSLTIPEIADGVIVATGGAVGSNIEEVVNKTKHFVEVLSTEVEKNDKMLELAKKLILKFKASAISEALSYRGCDTKEAAIADISEETACLAVSGMVSDKFIEDVINSKSSNPINLIIEDGSKLFVKKETLEKFKRRGGSISAVKAIKIICVTCNPTSWQGYDLDNLSLLAALRKSLNIPVINVNMPNS